MVETHTIDIAVANYNNGRYLKELIDSVLNQTSGKWHLIIVDDSSTDESAEIISPYLNDDRIKLIRHPFNQGATASFKTAIENGTSPYVALLGADDTLPGNCVQRLLEYFSSTPLASTVYTNANQCDSEMNYERPWPHTKPLRSNTPIYTQINAVFNLIAFKRSSYDKTEGLNPALRRAMDHDLIYKLDEVGQIEHLPEALYNYRVHDGGISQGGKNGQIAFQYAFLAKLHCWQRRGTDWSKNPESRIAYSIFHLRCLEHRFSYSNEPWLMHLFNVMQYDSTKIFSAVVAYLRLIFKRPSKKNEIHLSNLEKP